MRSANDPTRPTVLVLQVGTRAGPWACRSLRTGGYSVVGAHEAGDGRLTGWTRYGGRPLRYPSLRRNSSAFLAALEETCRHRPISAVLPASESAVHLLADESPDLNGARLIGPDRTVYDRLCDKAGLAATAAAVGVSTPASTLVDREGRQGDWPPLPNIVKPRASATPTGSEVVWETASVVKTVAERDSTVARLIAGTGGALVQEQVVGRAYRGQFVRTASELLFFPVWTVRRYPPATGMSSVSITLSAHEKLESVTRALVDGVGYRGPGAVQAIERDGELFVHDVNLRLEYAVGVCVAAGFDMPRLAVDDALGRKTDPAAVSPRSGQRYVWLTGELRGLVAALRRREAEAPPGRMAAELLLAAVSPRRVLDPFNLTDPLPLVATIATAVSARRRSS